MPLAMCSVGEKVAVRGIAGGRGIKGRLEAMGVVPGVVLEVVKSGPGPVVVKVNGNAKLALGYGEAMKIYVERVG